MFLKSLITQVKLNKSLLGDLVRICPPSDPAISFTKYSQFIIIIIIMIIIIINYNWVVTRWQWLFYMYTNMKKVTRFKSGGLLEKHVVATWKLGNHLSIRL